MTQYQAKSPRHDATRRTRDGFTLVELMMVILIIGILVAMVATVVVRFTDVGTQVQTTSEIRQLAIGVESFKLKYGVYPPSTFTLPPAAGSASDAYARRIWPRLPADVSALSWNGSGTLQGDQCLVYFLRGPSGTGWSTNPADPTAAGGTRVGPFFEFPANRLYVRIGDVSSFADPYATPAVQRPYVYFSTYSRPNGYNYSGTCSVTSGDTSVTWVSGQTYTGLTGPIQINGVNFPSFTVVDSTHLTLPSAYTGTTAATALFIISGDCPSLNVLPYCQASGRFYNPNSFQIISAGNNSNFGPGGAWSAGAGADYSTEVASGFDDLSNFHSSVLGVP